MDVSENSGTPKSSILIGCSIINHPIWGTPIFGNTHMGFDDNRNDVLFGRYLKSYYIEFSPYFSGTNCAKACQSLPSTKKKTSRWKCSNMWGEWSSKEPKNCLQSPKTSVFFQSSGPRPSFSACSPIPSGLSGPWAHVPLIGGCCFGSHWKHHVFFVQPQRHCRHNGNPTTGFHRFHRNFDGLFHRPGFIKNSTKKIQKVEIKLDYKWSCCFLVEALPFVPSGGYTRHLLWIRFGLPGAEKSFESAQQKKTWMEIGTKTSIWLNNGSSPSSVVMNKFHVKFYWSIRKLNPAPPIYTMSISIPETRSYSKPFENGSFPGLEKSRKNGNVPHYELLWATFGDHITICSQNHKDVYIYILYIYTYIMCISIICNEKYVCVYIYIYIYTYWQLWPVVFMISSPKNTGPATSLLLQTSPCPRSAWPGGLKILKKILPGRLRFFS